MAKRMYSIFTRSPTKTEIRTSGFYPSLSTIGLGAAEKSIVGSIFNRIAIDVSNNRFMHVKVDDEGFIEEIPDSMINRRLRYKPNINQSPSQFIRDIVLRLCSEGCAAVVTTYTNDDDEPEQIQVGSISGWYPEHVCVQLFNNTKQSIESVVVEKSKCAIIENPLYTVMNDNASGIKRLISKISQMDAYTAAATSGKINAFVGLDYDTSNPLMKQRARQRIEDLEEQMQNNKYGIYIHDSTDKITFPNKPIDIDVVDQVKYLEEQVFAELGLTRSVFTGEAKEDANRIYQAKTVEPFCRAISEGLTYMWISEDMFSQERIISTKSMFSGVTGTEIADMSDKLSRNAIVKGNEVRRELGLIKSDEPQANMLMNPNMPLQDQPIQGQPTAEDGKQTLMNIFNQNDTGASRSVPDIFQ